MGTGSEQAGISKSDQEICTYTPIQTTALPAPDCITNEGGVNHSQTSDYTGLSGRLFVEDWSAGETYSITEIRSIDRETGRQTAR